MLNKNNKLYFEYQKVLLQTTHNVCDCIIYGFTNYNESHTNDKSFLVTSSYNFVNLEFE